MFDDTLTYVLLTAAGYFGGLVDSIAGGGGLISLPALIAAGVPPHAALAVNKVQSAIGTSVSTYRYLKSGYVYIRLGSIGFIAAFLASYAGAWTVLRVPDSSLHTLIPILIVVVAAITFFRKDFGAKDETISLGIREHLVVVVLALTMGFYDGFFGPGAGTFLTFGFVLLLRFGFLRATAHAKLLNLASNYAAILAFVLAGEVYWSIALPMGLANIVGAWTGAGIAIRGGSRVIKPVFGLVLLALLASIIR